MKENIKKEILKMTKFTKVKEALQNKTLDEIIKQYDLNI